MSRPLPSLYPGPSLPCIQAPPFLVSRPLPFLYPGPSLPCIQAPPFLISRPLTSSCPGSSVLDYGRTVKHSCNIPTSLPLLHFTSLLSSPHSLPVQKPSSAYTVLLNYLDVMLSDDKWPSSSSPLLQKEADLVLDIYAELRLREVPSVVMETWLGPLVSPSMLYSII